MPIGTSNTGNTGAYNGAVFQVLRGQRTFSKLLGAPKAHANTSFPINTEYSITKNPLYFTETTENSPTVAENQTYSNEINTFSFMKKAIEITQTALNSWRQIASDNKLAEIGADYSLSEVWQAQFRPKLQEFALEYNWELINSTYTAFTPTANRTRGLIEAAQSYVATNSDMIDKTGADFVTELEVLLIALMKEGVTTGEKPVGFGTNQIVGTGTQRPNISLLTLMVNPATRHWIETTIRNAGETIFKIERSRSEAGTDLTLIITSFGIIQFEMDEDIPDNVGVIARFSEMNPVFQENHSLGAEGADGTISPEGAMISLHVDKGRKQGIGMEMFMRVGLNHSAPNRIGYVENMGLTTYEKKDSKKESKKESD